MSLGPSLVLPGVLLTVFHSTLAAESRGAYFGTVGGSANTTSISTTLHRLTATLETAFKCTVT